MNKWLVIWNIVLTVLMMVLVIGGCAPGSAQLTSLESLVQADKASISQLQATVTQQGQQIQGQAAQIAGLQTSMQVSLQQLSASIQQYVQQYVQTYVPGNK